VVVSFQEISLHVFPLYLPRKTLNVNRLRMIWFDSVFSGTVGRVRLYSKIHAPRTRMYRTCRVAFLSVGFRMLFVNRNFSNHQQIKIIRRITLFFRRLLIIVYFIFGNDFHTFYLDWKHSVDVDDETESGSIGFTAWRRHNMKIPIDRNIDIDLQRREEIYRTWCFQ